MFKEICSRCRGSGEMTKTTTHLGPDDYDYPDFCDKCNGTGEVEILDDKKEPENV